MDYLRTLVIAGLFSAVTAHAGYAQLAPPERFSGGPGAWKFAPSANDARYGKIAFTPNGLRVPVPGVNVTMPAAYRFASNAPKVAAAVLFANPYLRAGIGIATWLGVAKIVWDEVDKVWKKNDETLIDEYGYFLGTNPGYSYTSPEAACSDALNYFSARIAKDISRLSDAKDACLIIRVFDANDQRIMSQPPITKSKKPCPAGTVSTPGGCLGSAVPRPLTTPQEFESELFPKPMPDTVPWELPFPTPLPVDDPFINPSPSPNPQHKPKFVPTGEPVKNPNYDPNAAPGPANEPWLQPGIRVTPKPTSSEPWRVQIDPVNVPQSGPEPLPDTPNEPGPNDQAKPEEQQSLCEKHPDIVACQKLGTLEPVDLQKKSVALTIDKEDGFGPSNGACPAPKSFVIMGKPMAFRWDLLCDFATQIRPLLVGFAYLSAALAFMGLSRRD